MPLKREVGVRQQADSKLKPLSPIFLLKITSRGKKKVDHGPPYPIAVLVEDTFYLVAYLTHFMTLSVMKTPNVHLLDRLSKKKFTTVLS